MPSIKHVTIKSAKWNFLERVSVQGIQFMLGIVMARLLVPSDYGIVGMLAIFFAISESFIDSGFSTALIRKKSPTDDDFSTTFYFNLAISLAVYAILFFIAPYVAQFFDIPILRSILRVQSITLIINAIMAVQVTMLKIRLDFKSLAKRNITATVISGICGVTLAYIGYGIWALVFQQIIAAFINLVFICVVCRWIPKTRFNLVSFKELGKFGSRILAGGLLDTLYMNMTTLAIGKFYTPQDLGFYSRGMQFAHVPNNSINGVLQTVTYPILAKLQDDDDRLINAYRKYIRMTSMVIFIIAGILCALAKPIILLFLTKKWAEAIVYLQIFSITYMFDHLCTINLNLLKVKGRADLYLRLEIIKKSIAFIILLCSIPLGVLAICLSKLLNNHIAVYINTYYTGKMYRYGYLKQAKDVAPFFIYCILSCLPTYILTLLEMPHLITILLGSAFSLFLYWFMLRKNADMIELTTLFKDKFRRRK